MPTDNLSKFGEILSEIERTRGTQPQARTFRRRSLDCSDPCEKGPDLMQ